MATEMKIYENTGETGTDASGVTVTGNINTTASNGNPAPAFGNTSAAKNGFTFEGFSLSGYSNLRLSLDAKFGNFPTETTTWPYLEVKFYKNSSVVQTDITTVKWSEKNNTYSNYSIAITNDFDKIEFIGHPAEGKTGKGADATNYGLYFDNVTIWGESSDPVISADDVDLGEVLYEPEGEYEHEISIDVVGANLTNDIEFSTTSTKLTIKTADALPSVGGSLLVAIKTQACTLNEEIVLQSGTLQKKITISGKVFEKIYNPGTDATFVTPAETDTAYLVNGEGTPYTVYGAEAIKVGTGSKLGKAKIKVPATATKLYFMAAAWAGNPCNIAITAPEGVTLTNDSANNQGKTHLYADAGLSGEGPAYKTAKGDWALYQYEIGLSGLTGETVIELASTARSTARFFVWNPTYEESAAPKSHDATIKSVTINGQAITEKDGVFAYELPADQPQAEVAVAFVLNDANATADHVSPFNMTVPAPEVDPTEEIVTVTAEDGTTTKEYTFRVSQAAAPEKSHDASVKSLTINDVEITAVDNVYEYTVPAELNIAQVKVEFELNDDKATASPESGFAMAVPESSTDEPSVETFTVTAEDGETSVIYTVRVLRAAPGEKSHIATIASLSINGEEVEENDGKFAFEVPASENLSQVVVAFTLTDEKASADKTSPFMMDVPVSHEAAPSVATIKVTAEDGTTIKEYTVTITRGEAQGIEDIVLTEKAQKVSVDGAVYVIRDNKMYNVTGTRVR